MANSMVEKEGLAVTQAKQKHGTSWKNTWSGWLSSAKETMSKWEALF